MNAKEIKELRKSLNLSQEEFANLIGVSKNTVYNYENGSKIPASKITILLQLKNNKTNIPKEKTLIFETGFDKKIAETRTQIEKVKQEIAVWEEKIKEKPNNKEEYEKYIANYEKQIFLLNEIINITLEAKRDFLESQNESENE